MLSNIQIGDADIEVLEAEEGLKFNEQRRAIMCSMDTIDIQACPGSGKTTLIASKLILLSEKWSYRHNGICVLSHTNVAKDEIVNRINLSKLKNARRLLSYPHFIGTIQEFVNRFVGLPAIRSDKIDIKSIDDNLCVELVRSKISYGTRNYIDNKKADLLMFRMNYKNGELGYEVPIKAGPHTNSYKDLLKVRNALTKDGYFFYRDLYAYSEKIIFENGALISFLRRRFPLVLLDEMQDTQSFQDELIAKIFLQGDSTNVVQRFGDPDQAIFNGLGDDKLNASYNSKTTSDMFAGVAISDSNRFSNSIASKIKGLSKNKLPLVSSISEQRESQFRQLNSKKNDFDHTIILFNQETVTEVLSAYAKIVADNFKDVKNLVVKAVGANGSETSQFTIRNYFPAYNQLANKREITTDSLIDVIRCCRARVGDDAELIFDNINKSIVTLMRKSNRRDLRGKYFSERTLMAFLKNTPGRYFSYKKLLYDILRGEQDANAEKWTAFVMELKSILEIDGNPTFLEFKDILQQTADSDSYQNYFFDSGVQIKVSTIHSVKGETHDATLVFETKNGQYDISLLLPWMMDSQLPIPDTVRKQKFMKELYVAMSRPKHLLCLAIDKGNIEGEGTLDILKSDPYRWNVLDLTQRK